MKNMGLNGIFYLQHSVFPEDSNKEARLPELKLTSHKQSVKGS